MESNLKNMVIVLTVITLVAATAVGGVYVLTKELIEKAQIDKTNAAIAEVMPKFDNDPSSEKFKRTIQGDTVNVYPAKMGDQMVGYAIETFSKNGFGGKISLLVGFTTDGRIKQISVLEHKETPGLGDKIEPEKSDFSVQFEGVDPLAMKLSVKKDGGDVDAITASTITSRAYTEAVASAYRLFQELTLPADQLPAAVDSASGATSIKTESKTEEGKSEYKDAHGASGATSDGNSGATKVEKSSDEKKNSDRGRTNKQERGRKPGR